MKISVARTYIYISYTTIGNLSTFILNWFLAGNVKLFKNQVICFVFLNFGGNFNFLNFSLYSPLILDNRETIKYKLHEFPSKSILEKY